jgi:hypothetical protein
MGSSVLDPYEVVRYGSSETQDPSSAKPRRVGHSAKAKRKSTGGAGLSPRYILRAKAKGSQIRPALQVALLEAVEGEGEGDQHIEDGVEDHGEAGGGTGAEWG